MWSVIYVYPAGRVGAGLVLLRLGVAGSGLVLAQSSVSLGGWALAASLLVAIALCTGFRTRLAAVIGAIAMPLLGYDAAPLQNLILHLIGSAALGLIGPGAYSIDSRLYGRRRIILPHPGDAVD